MLFWHSSNMMERRELLKTGAALVAGAALARPQSSAPPKAKITSSVMLWTLKGSFEEKLEIAARAGLQSVELVGEYAALVRRGHRAREENARGRSGWAWTP